MAKTKNSKAKTKKTRKLKKTNNLFMIFAAMFIILMIVGYFVLGLLFTVFMGVGILIIAGLAKLVDSVKNKPKKKKIVNTILIIVLSIGILVMLLGIVFMIYIAISSNPKFDAEKLDSSEPTVLYNIDNEEFAKLGSEMRDKVTYDELPEVLVDAIVATEDSRFFQHNGFDAPRFLRASIGQVFGNSDAGGASTLSMQVVKNSLTSSIATGLDGVIRKFQDIYLSIFKLEKNYTKEQIIEFYVNNHNLGGNVYGVSQAARVYFNKDVGDLNLAEASIIAGMFQAPNAYRPTNEDNIEAVTKRRDTVLYLMERHGYITKEERDIASNISIESLVNYNAEADTSGNSEYQGYIDTVVAEVEEKVGKNPYTTSMKIYTNLDTEKQDGLNRVMNGEGYNWINDVIQSGVAVLDSETGKILAVGAGRNKTGVNQFNYATDMVRQPGSTAKPLFDYGPLIEYNNASTFGYNDGNDNYKMFVDEPYSYSNGQEINNWDGKFMGNMTTRRALSLSRNIPALKAFQQVDNKKIIEFVQKLGIEPEIENGKIHEAHALGAFDGVNPLQMAAAYSAFSNGGYYNEPYSVSKVIINASGEEYTHESKKTKAMEDSTAYMITSMLDDTSITGGGAMENVAMKTGTTNFDENYRKKLGMKGATINREIGVLRRMMTMAENYGWINYNPAVKRYIKPLKVENKKIKILDKQEVATLLKCCYGECEFLKPIFLCALHTGMRKSEILQLEWGNVDIEQQLITILKQKNGKKSEIPISSPLLHEFKKLKLQKSSKYVFVNPLTNAPYVNIRYSIQKVFKRAGLENFTFHGLRHTACTRLIELNVPLDVVKDIMRHSNINITLDVYNHIKQERKREAIELLSNY